MVTGNYPTTGSTLVTPQGYNKTSTALSTNIIIRVGTIAVGAVQSLAITESRSVKTIAEVGTDGFIDSAPTGSTNVTVNCTRIRFDKLRVAQAFSRGFIHVSAQRYPFDIDIYDNQSQDESNRIVTTVRNCWITNINYTYSADNWIVSETMNCQAETIYSTLGGLATGKPVGDIIVPRLVNPFNNDIEREADIGRRRGGLDAPGLIDLGDVQSPLF